LKIHEFKSSDLDRLPGTNSKLIHSFGALADLGQEIVNRNTFQETIRTSLHLMLGSLAIMRGGVAGYSRYEHEFYMLSTRGLGRPLLLSATPSLRHAIAKVLSSFTASCSCSIPSSGLPPRSIARVASA
jgi:hypothetical protein